MEGCKMVEPYLNRLGGNVEDDVSMFSGGLNTYVDKAFLEPDQMPYCMNMEIGNPPEIRTRASRTTLAYWMNLQHEWPYSLGNILEIFTYSTYQTTVLASKNGAVHVYSLYRPVQNGARTYYYDIKDLGTVPSADNYYFTIAKTEAHSYVYITGVNFKKRFEITDNPLANSLIPVADGKYGICCCHKGRMFLADPEKNTIIFSALRDYDNFDTPIQYQLLEDDPMNPLQPFTGDSGIVYLYPSSDASKYNTYTYSNNTWVPGTPIAKKGIIIDTTTGLSLPDYSIIAGQFTVTNAVGHIVALKSFDDKLVIFCEHSMHVVYGSTPDMTLSEHFQLVDLNNNLGAKSERCIAIGGGRMFWLGDNNEVYEYSGASINIISRPGKTRNSTLSIGGVSGVIDAYDVFEWRERPISTGGSHSKFVATSEKLYINIWNAKETLVHQKFLFVFDIYNRTWWCEDGEFNTIGDFSFYDNKILLANSNGDVLVSNDGHAGGDKVYDFEKNKAVTQPIDYEFHTRVYGADGADLRESLAKIWFQADAKADVYLDDEWTSWDRWKDDNVETDNMLKIGELHLKHMQPDMKDRYRPHQYEQQVCYTQKMYGQRLNTFQIIVIGEGKSSFYLMKREWRAR